MGLQDLITGLPFVDGGSAMSPGPNTASKVEPMPIKTATSARTFEEAPTLSVPSTPDHKSPSPIYSLPEELIREICIACVDSYQCPSVSRSEAPLLLTRISRDIRRIALITPTLWATINIDYSYFRKYPSIKAISRMRRRSDDIKEWLHRRSGTLPLSISVKDTRDDLVPLYPTIVDGVIDNILSCCARWRVLSIEDLCPPLTRIAAVNPGAVPLLQSLTLDLDTDAHIFYYSTLFRARNLKEFSLTYNRHTTAVEYPVNWWKFTNLKLSVQEPFHAISSVAHILHQSVRLVSCEIIVGINTEVINVEEISLPSLRILSVNDISGRALSGAGGILAFMNAPVLEKLSLGHLPETVSLTSFLQSSPHIQDLYMTCASSTNSLMECLRYCPSLKSLRIRSIRDSTPPDDIFLEAFVGDDVNRRLCPELENFRCGFWLTASLRTVRRFYTRKQGNIQGLNRWKDVVIYVGSDESAQDEMDILVSEMAIAGGLKPRPASLIIL